MTLDSSLIFLLILVVVLTLLFKWLKPKIRQANAQRAEALKQARAQEHRLMFQAKSGDAHSQYSLGQLYAQELGLSSDDLEEARKWYRLAAESGLAKAQFELAESYSFKNGDDGDPDEALKWYRLAAEQGLVQAQYELSNFAEMIAKEAGTGDEEEAQALYAEALKWRRAAAAQGDAEAKEDLALTETDLLREASRTIPSLATPPSSSPTEPLKKRRPLLIAFVLISVLSGLGLTYYSSSLFEEPADVSAVVQVEATEATTDVGSGVATEAVMVDMSNLDPDAALADAIKASESGEIDSDGPPVEPCFDNFSTESLLASAKQRDFDAQYRLAMHYTVGCGVRQNFVLAAKWLFVTAQHGDSSSMKKLGEFYQEGLGVPQSDSEAVKWYERAAAKNLPEAQVALGRIYLEGSDEVAQDKEKAKAWFKKAAKLGDEDAKAALKDLKD